MTVEQLMQKLQKLPPSSLVFGCAKYWGCPVEVDDVYCLGKLEEQDEHWVIISLDMDGI